MYFVNLLWQNLAEILIYDFIRLERITAIFSDPFYIDWLGYGFAMGQLFYIRELAPKGPALLNGEVHPGDRVIEVSTFSKHEI